MKNICERLPLTFLINFTISSEFQNQLSQFKELQLELGEMNEIKDSLVREIRDMEKRMKATEQETEVLQDKLKSSERSRRAVRFPLIHSFPGLDRSFPLKGEMTAKHFHVTLKDSEKFIFFELCSCYRTVPSAIWEIFSEFLIFCNLFK